MDLQDILGIYNQKKSEDREALCIVSCRGVFYSFGDDAHRISTETKYELLKRDFGTSSIEYVRFSELFLKTVIIRMIRAGWRIVCFYVEDK